MSKQCYPSRIDNSLGDVMSARAQLDYEESIIKQCRDWVNHDCNDLITLEHVRVLLSWLDAATPDREITADF